MINFEAKILRFEKMGEKTGWHHVLIPSEVLRSLKLANNKSFYIKGSIDAIDINYHAVFPIGNGMFIIPIQKSLLTQLKKKEGDKICLQIALDTSEYVFNEDLMMCLEEDIYAKEKFLAIKLSERKYYSKWVDSAKTIETRAKRIAKIIHAMHENLNYPEMLRLK